MRPLATHLLLLASLFRGPSLLEAQTTDTWLFAIDHWGNTEYQTAELEESGGQLTGMLGGWTLRGRQVGSAIEFTAMDRLGIEHPFWLSRDGDRVAGTTEYPDPNDASVRVEHSVTGRLLPPRLSDGPTRRVYEPSSYSNEFSAHQDPALVIWPGDTVVTKTLDSGGLDEHGVTRALYGNPQVGPFFVFGAQPGDVLAIRILDLALNRDFADGLRGIAERAMTTRLAMRATDVGGRVRWELDREAGVARLKNPPEALADYTVPLRPMLGGVGVAPDFGWATPSAGETGRFGGNMDFNGVTAGTTVFLPVLQPGALLYLGDGHALQGDGETTQWALETSLDVELRVDVIRGQALGTPRVETETHYATIGQASSLDEAIKLATAGMVQWLEQDYGLDIEASSLVLGTAAEYRVSTIAGRNAGIVLQLPKVLLQPLSRD